MNAVIGLEVHVQLRTRSKLFCGCRADYGASPNTHVCEICFGLPGALPVLNQGAVDLALRAAVALGFEVRERSSFARKHYFYPDLPRGYQITQHERPLGIDGSLVVPRGGARVRLRRIQLEEDSGRSLHTVVAGATALDFNRAGVPLVEIVTEPEIATAAAARAFLLALKRVLEYTGVSDCNMEQGSLRVDANVSVRDGGERHAERTEIKNLNSFSGVERAIDFEIARQRESLARGAPIFRETRLWDAAAGVSHLLRDKEESEDYRYLTDGDLPPVHLPSETVEIARGALPELPMARGQRIATEYQLPARQVDVLASSRERADRFEEVVQHGVPAELAASWLLGEDLSGGGAMQRISATELALLLRELDGGRITRAQARQVAAEAAGSGRSAAEVLESLGDARAATTEAVRGWAAEVIERHPAETERYRAGDHRLLNFFLGEAMKLSRGSADPNLLADVLRTLLFRSNRE